MYQGKFKQHRAAYVTGHEDGLNGTIDEARYRRDPFYARGAEVGDEYYRREFLGSVSDHGPGFIRPRPKPLPRRRESRDSLTVPLAEEHLQGKGYIPEAYITLSDFDEVTCWEGWRPLSLA